jgi:hypothetical protein
MSEIGKTTPWRWIIRDAISAILGTLVPLFGLCVLAGQVPPVQVVDDPGFWWMIFIMWLGSFFTLYIRRAWESRSSLGEARVSDAQGER